MLNELLASSPKEIDLTSDEHSNFVMDAVQSILDSGY